MILELVFIMQVKIVVKQDKLNRGRSQGRWGALAGREESTRRRRKRVTNTSNMRGKWPKKCQTGMFSLLFLVFEMFFPLYHLALFFVVVFLFLLGACFSKTHLLHDPLGLNQGWRAYLQAGLVPTSMPCN